MSGANTATQGHVEAITTLFVAFPEGATANQVDLYAERLCNFDVVDLIGGVQRLIDTHTRRRAPSVAELRMSSIAARTDRLGQERVRQIEGPKAHPLHAHELELVRKVRDLGREGLYWCGVSGRFSERPVSPEHADQRGKVYRDVAPQAIESAWHAHGGEALRKARLGRHAEVPASEPCVPTPDSVGTLEDYF